MSYLFEWVCGHTVLTTIIVYLLFCYGYELVQMIATWKIEIKLYKEIVAEEGCGFLVFVLIIVPITTPFEILVKALGYGRRHWTHEDEDGTS